MSAEDHVPTLTLGLPTYNGQRYLAEALDSILAQTLTDFELIISDNCSTDDTEAIARRYSDADPRIRYFRQPVNRGIAYNHNFTIQQARGEFFKWLSDDDLYAPELLADCLEGLRERPDAVLAHAWTAYIDDTGEVTHRPPYPLQTDDPRPVTRFRSLLYTQGGDDIYGVIRMSVLRKAQKLGSHHYSDRTFVTDLALYGAFYNVPEFLYFRRDHPQRASRATQDIRQRCTRLDPARANRWLHPTPRLLAEYILSYTSAIYRAPLTAAERFGCYRELLVWGLGHVNPLHRRQLLQSPDPAFRAIGSDALATRVSNGVLRVGQQFRGAIRKIMSGNT